MKLKNRIKSAMIVTLMVVLALDTAIILFYISSYLRRSAEDALTTINEQKMVTADNLLDNLAMFTGKPMVDESIIDILKKDYTAYPEKTRRYHEYQDIDKVEDWIYLDMFYQNSYIYSVVIYSDKNDYIYSKQRSGKSVRDIDIKNTSWYKKLSGTDGQTAVLFPRAEEELYSGEEPIISVGRRLKDPMTNEAIGVIRIDVAEKSIAEILRNGDEGSEDDLIWLDKSGNLLYTTLPIDSWEESYEEAKRTEFCVSDKSDSYQLSMTSLRPKADLYRSMRNTVLIIIGITAACAVVALSLTDLIVTHSLKPVRELNEKMKRVRAGDLTVRIPIHSTGEFEEVCQVFNEMVENISDLIGQVRREENEKREAEYRALQAQISPHFISNTLNTIKWMAVIQGNKSIEKALDSFSHMLSFVVRESDEKIPIRVEAEQMKYYIDILSLRYYGKFNIFTSSDPDVGDYYTIKYLLQTIVENSVFHGFDGMKEPGRIDVSIRHVGEEILYEVRDNGCGIEKDRIDSILNSPAPGSSKGFVKIGLNNIQRRIHLIFGAEYGIAIESEPGQFTIVRVRLPAQKVQDYGENNRS